MLTGITRLSSRAQKLDPRCFLHMSVPAPQNSQVPAERPRAVSRTSDSDPAKHGEQHEGQHYSIPPQDLKTVFPHGLPPRYMLQVKTFGEACLMVRRPALELLGYLKNTNFAHPAVRCAHLWVKNCRELLQSTYNKQRFDQPLEASTWLKNFKTTNERFLSQIKVQEKYVWNKRESTEKGSPLGEVVEQGLTRVRNATDAVGVVLKELKTQSARGLFHLLVAVDGANALWGRTTLRREDRTLIAPEELSLVHNLRKMVKNDWEGFNALEPFLPILIPNYNPKEFESSFQYYLENNWLQHEKANKRMYKCGWKMATVQHLTVYPCLSPTRSPLSEAPELSTHCYTGLQKFLTLNARFDGLHCKHSGCHPGSSTEEGRKELRFLSNCNPGQLERLCAAL
ncbi:28S ribosomal protein S29, mitochondrial [Apodemus speciosus]|uniref:Small ribosomal subunit protein mS29 n=1 Tax=Apodemus speciosus TaxID=105296 RepID=A0ABQ0EL28_APOSI